VEGPGQRFITAVEKCRMRQSELGCQMIMTTLDGIAGHITEETLGVVRGTAMWTQRMTKTSMGGIRHVHATTMQDLDQGLQVAKEQAQTFMKEQARKLGADAVVGFRMEITELSNGSYCINASGTAVKTVKLPANVPLPPPVAATDPFSSTMDEIEVDLGVALYAARASFEGSTLRH
jgi:uncharacterized protein YbjQ (UPF0145 family)